MKKTYLIRDPEVFQGEKYLKSCNKNYFEGWYFKNTNGNEGISFIPGINIDSKNKKAFIQVITNDKSYFVDYDIEQFEYKNNPFYIRVGNSFFSREFIEINIEDEKESLNIKGRIIYSNCKNIKKNFYNPNIMGPFSYIPNMECNHAILCMKSSATGLIAINNKEINLNNGVRIYRKRLGIFFSKIIYLVSRKPI